jgi:hypothetical protein
MAIKESVKMALGGVALFALGAGVTALGTRENCHCRVRQQGTGRTDRA